MAVNLTFSKFKNQEFDAISELLCNIFDTTKAELELLYKEIIDDFDKDGWPSHFVSRSFFKSEYKEFQKTYEIPPVIAVHLPSLFDLDSGIDGKPTIMILGQDSKSDQASEQIRLGTPYGLHHKGSREILRRTPHPSGAANGTWKRLMNQSPTYGNKLAYWNAEISKVLPKSI